MINLKQAVEVLTFLVAASITASVAASNNPVNIQSGACEDSTCVRRDISLSVKDPSKSSATTSSSVVVYPSAPAKVTAGTCKPDVEYSHSMCAVPMTGTWIEARDYTCSSPNSGSWGPWYNVGNTCARPSPETTIPGPITFPTQPPQPPSTPPAPSCTEADNVNPAFWPTNDQPVMVMPDPSWPEDFCDFDYPGGNRYYQGSSQIPREIFSMHQCQGGQKVRVMVAQDGMCQHGWFDQRMWSNMMGASGQANLQKHIDKFVQLNPGVQH